MLVDDLYYVKIIHDVVGIVWIVIVVNLEFVFLLKFMLSMLLKMFGYGA